MSNNSPGSEEELRAGLAAHLRADGQVSGPSYEAHRMVVRLHGAAECDPQKDVICSFEGTAAHADLLSIPPRIATEFLIGGAVGELFTTARGLSYAARLERIQQTARVVRNIQISGRVRVASRLGAHFEREAAALGGRVVLRRSILREASEAAFRAADDVGSFVPKNKHLLGGGSQSKARFVTSELAEVRGLVQEALRSPNAQFLPNPNVPGTFRVVTNLGRSIGVKGQQSVRVIVGLDGKVINAFPVHVR